jgi:hypothetical protein
MTTPCSAVADRGHAIRQATAPTNAAHRPRAATAEHITPRHPTEEVPA